jgi:hypothetical protein
MRCRLLARLSRDVCRPARPPAAPYRSLQGSPLQKSRALASGPVRSRLRWKLFMAGQAQVWSAVDGDGSWPARRRRQT